MSHMEKVTDTVVAALERRMLFKRAARGAAAVAAVGALAGTGLAVSSAPAKAAPSAAQDLAILNFALNLEYLEAEYYLRAVTGQGLAAVDRASGDGTMQGGAVTTLPNTLVSFATPIISQFADTIAADEQAHVRFLRSALGAAAVASPAIDVGTAFTTLAVAAGIVKAGQTFNPYQDENAFLLGAYIFEDVGVTAYGGAANMILDPGYLAAAASILAVEAYHSGTVRTLLTIRGGGAATDAVSSLRSTLSTGFAAGAAGSDDFGTLDPNGIVHLAPLDTNALTFRRTTTQVLKIVYGSAAAVPVAGLFFPAGMNGAIK